MDGTDLSQGENRLPTITLLTGNELLGLFFRHFFGEHAKLDLSVLPPESCSEADADLFLLDAGHIPLNQLSELLRQLDAPFPVALVNITPEHAEHLVGQHPHIRGVFYSHARCEHLLSGVRALLDGGDWLPRMLTTQLLCQWRHMRRRKSNPSRLTLREREILTLASNGLSNAEIAERLSLSPHTIKSHIHNLLRKIGASSRAEAAQLLHGSLEQTMPCRA